MDNIGYLRIFQSVARARSFSRAAQVLGLPKATVSMSVRALEAAVGTRLLERTTRSVRVTHDGAIFLERSHGLLDAFDELLGMFRTMEASVKGRIRFAIPAGHVARDLILPHLRDFMTTYPSIELELSATDRPLDLVRDGFDCALHGGPSVDMSMVTRRFPDVEVGTFASPDYLQRYGTPETPQDLEKHRLIHYAPSFANRNVRFMYTEKGEIRSVSMPCAIVLDNSDALEDACVCGLGILQAPVPAVAQRLKLGSLVPLLPAYKGIPLQLALVYPNRRHMAHRMIVFLDWLEKVVRDHAPFSG